MLKEVFVTARAETEIFGRVMEKDTVAAMPWHMVVSNNPLHYAISVPKEHFLAELIEKGKCFIVHFMPRSMEEKRDACLQNNGKFLDKFLQAGFRRVEASRVDAPRIRNALGYLECELLEKVEHGNHYLFIGKVVEKVGEKPLLEQWAIS
ncbi:flavin reductase family protein [Candidatus Woesearchaeota archaeon]|nr:flavin reductase family protein [Candidatus Woesearchaeota archaeon]